MSIGPFRPPPQPGDPDYDPGAYQQPGPFYTNPVAPDDFDPGAFQQPGPPPPAGTGVETPSSGFGFDPTSLPGYVYPPGFDPSPPPGPPPAFLRDFDPFTATPSRAPSRLPNTSTAGGMRAPQQQPRQMNYRPAIQQAMRGLSRSPYARWAFGRQPLSAPTFGQFSPEGLPPDDDEELRRQMEAALAAGQLPAWAGL